MRDLATLRNLLEPANGFYNPKNDSVTVEIWLKVNKAYMAPSRRSLDENHNRVDVSGRQSLADNNRQSNC
jgi:hypothetical protein